MRYPDARLIIFTKAPVPGLVKTRLAVHMGDNLAAQTHKYLTLHTLDMASEQQLCPIELWCAPDASHPFFQECQEKYPVTLHAQQGGNLGERMAHAFETTLASGYRAIMIGTDCPHLSNEHLHGALDALSNNHDAVITPAEDGGYVLIGLRRFSPTLFTNIAWGTHTVYQATCHQLQQLGWPWFEHGQLWDIDTPADMDRLLALSDAPIPARLKKLIDSLQFLSPKTW